MKQTRKKKRIARRRKQWLDDGYALLNDTYGIDPAGKSVAELRDEAAICRLGGETSLAKILDLGADEEAAKG